MASIDELMEGKQPGTICITKSNVPRFRPYFKTSSFAWYGLDCEGRAIWIASGEEDGWCLWQPPKKKVVRYLWAHKEAKFLYGKGELLSEEEFVYAIPACGTEAYMRLNWSATEMDE